MPRIAVLGVGNVLAGDDALGPYVVKVLEALYAFPQDVTLVDAGTRGLDLAAYMAGLEALVAVDTVRAAGRPGELRLVDKAALVERPPVQALSPHEPGLREALLTAEFAGAAPARVLLVGVIPERVETGIGLSPAVRAAVGPAVAAVRHELERLGAVVEERVPAVEPDLWWERDPRA